MQQEQTHRERPSRYRGAFQLIFLLLLLVVAPLGSWLYLRSGLSYRKEHLATLTDGKPIPAASWQREDGTTISTAHWKDQISLVLFADDSIELKSQQEQLSLVLSQFDDRDDVMFYQVTEVNPLDHSSAPADTAQWKLLSSLSVRSDPFRAFCQQNSPAGSMDRIYLIDRRGQLRQAFPFQSQKELTQLVEVVAILLPPKKLTHPELNRTRER